MNTVAEPWDHGADAEGDGEDEGVAAQEVAQDGGERGAAAVGEGAAENEQDARAGYRDHDEGRRGECQKTVGTHHGPGLARLRSPAGEGLRVRARGGGDHLCSLGEFFATVA
ncbi:hypothetical protein [Nonomuraea sp. NPDC049504]|uniref:hypothetical protein n=1 Tax=Nonomuraea sp. NPDC049504 TaxID=3154729 RepID=UPI0034179C99